MATIASMSSSLPLPAARAVSIVIDQQPPHQKVKNISCTPSRSLSSSSSLSSTTCNGDSSSANTFSSTLIDISGSSVATISSSGTSITTNSNSNTIPFGDMEKGKDVQVEKLSFAQAVNNAISSCSTSQESSATNTSNPDDIGERRKSKEISSASSSTITASSNGNIDGISISYGAYVEDDDDDDDDDDDVGTNTTAPSTKRMVIQQCNESCDGNDDDDDHDADHYDIGSSKSTNGNSISIISSSSSASGVHQQNEFANRISRVATATETDCAASESPSFAIGVKDFHVLKITISPDLALSEQQQFPKVEGIDRAQFSGQVNGHVNCNNEIKSEEEDGERKYSKVIELTAIGEHSRSKKDDKSLVTVVNLCCSGNGVGGTVQKRIANVENSIDESVAGLKKESIESQLKIDSTGSVQKMVQKPQQTVNGIAANSQNQLGNSGNTTVTELNVSNPGYLYYMMTSGQFSPCDSGTCSDMDTHSNGTTASTTPPPPPIPLQPKLRSNGCNVAVNGSKLELHLKTTISRTAANLSTSATSGGGGTSSASAAVGSEKHKSIRNKHDDHQRAGSLTDSEESESSLSCDSINSSEFLNTIQSDGVASKTITAINTGSDNGGDKISSFLPDSLLRDIRGRKFVTNDFEKKYSGNLYEKENKLLNGNDYDDVDIGLQHDKYLNERNKNNLKFDKNSFGQPRNSKTFVLNIKDGTFVDTKMNSMPRTYEADKFYNFHVNEHDNYRSFGSSNNSSLTDCETRSLHEDAFAGYRDISGSSSATSTIRSSKGTVRGVKNRVRNGIATFLQLQQSNVKNYKEKDLGKVVLYTTSMGIIRDTYAKCSNMKQILRTLLVKFEERDVFMSMEYQQEIKERMHSEEIKVPQLFVEGQHIGDAEHVERLNESGELRQLLKPYKSISTTYTCQTCGGYRLLPCPSCNGSKKSVHRNHFTAEFVALKCMNCDEVGLVKCHNC